MKSILSLYEVVYVGGYEDDILEEVFVFIIVCMFEYVVNKLDFFLVD